MKKIRIISLFVLMFTLASCQESKAVGIDRPTFSNYKNEVSYASFIESLNSAVSSFAISPSIANEESKSFSFEGKRQSTKTESNKNSGKGKEMVNKTVTTDLTTTAKGSFDKNNYLFDYEGNNKEVVNSKIVNNEQNYEIATDTNHKFQLQITETKEEEKVVSIFNKNSHILTETDVAEDKLNSLTVGVAEASIFYSSYNIPSSDTWSALSDEAKAKYHFYVDSTTFTLSFQDQVDVERKEVLPSGEERVISQTKRDDNLLMQFVFTQSDVKYHEYHTNDSMHKVNEFLNNFISTDTTESKSVIAVDSYIKLDETISLTAESSDGYYEGDESLNALYFK